MPKELPKPEWSYKVRADSIPNNGRHVKMKATPDDCAGMLDRVLVDSVEKLEASLALSLQNAGHVLYVQGNFVADVVQSCVVSGKPVPSHIEDSFEAWFADNDKAVTFKRVKHDAQLKSDGEEVQMLEEHEDPEPMVDGQVDLADLVVQFFSLAINPYPRHPSSVVENEVDAPVAAKVLGSHLRPNPFAALKNWRPKD